MLGTNGAYIRGVYIKDTSTKSAYIGCTSIIDAGDACACASNASIEGAGIEDDCIGDNCVRNTGATKR